VIRRLEIPSEVAAARELGRSLCDGQSTLSAEWLQSTHARVIAQESGRHLEPGEDQAVADAYAEAGTRALIAVITDTLVAEEEAYVLSVTTNDLRHLSDELVGINFLLSDEAGLRCILFTADDYKLNAGPIRFVKQVAGDPVKAREEFVAFAADELAERRTVLERAASYMQWVLLAE
jgi:hypothetical protein